MPRFALKLQARERCLTEAPGMPGGPTMKIMDLGDSRREVKGLESLGVYIAGRPVLPRRDVKTLESWEAARATSLTFRVRPLPFWTVAKARNTIRLRVAVDTGARCPADPA
jgi:hypothetical protein